MAKQRGRPDQALAGLAWPAPFQSTLGRHPNIWRGRPGEGAAFARPLRSRS